MCNFPLKFQPGYIKIIWRNRKPQLLSGKWWYVGTSGCYPGVGGEVLGMYNQVWVTTEHGNQGQAYQAIEGKLSIKFRLTGMV